MGTYFVIEPGKGVTFTSPDYWVAWAYAAGLPVASGAFMGVSTTDVTVTVRP